MTSHRRGAASDGAAQDSGFTLIEMVVALAIVAIALALVAPIYVVVSSSSTRAQAISEADTAMRPALQAFYNQVSSAGVVYSPCPGSGTNYSYQNAGNLPACKTSSSGSPSGFAILFYTSITTTTTRSYCSQWRVSANLLQDRTWDPSNPPSSLPFTTVASGVYINNTSVQQPFSLAAATGTGAQLVTVDLWVAKSTTHPINVEAKTAVAAQGQAQGTCSPPSTSS